MARRRRRPSGDNPTPSGGKPVVALVIDAVFPYHLGGREVRYHELTKRLSQHASVHVYTMQWWEGPRTLVDGDITFHAISRNHAMYVKGRRSLKQASFFALGCMRLLWHRFDVLSADHIPYFQILVLRLIADLRRKRFVVTWHEVWSRASWREYLGWMGVLAWLTEWLAMRLPDSIIAASAQTEQRLRAVVGSRALIAVAPNGVDLDAINSADPDGNVTDLVVVGRLVNHKRVDMLLDAISRLHAAGVLATCRIIGDGPEREALHHQAEVQGLSTVVDFRHGVRSQTEVYALVKAARIAVFPSEREGFGAAVLEALACGVPVVTTSAPDNLSKDLVSRSARGFVCAPSADALATTLQHLLADPELRRGEPDPWIGEYSWETVVRAMMEPLDLAAQPQRASRAVFGRRLHVAPGDLESVRATVDLARDRKLNVALFVHYQPPHIGGIEVVAARQAASLAAADATVTVITSACGASAGLTKSHGYSVRRIRAWNYFEDRWNAVYPLFSPSLIWHGYKAVQRADVVHAHDAFYLPSLVAAVWARRCRKPLIVTQHVDFIPHPNPLVRFGQRFIYSTTGSFVLRSSQRVIVLNSRVAAFLVDRGIDQSKVTFLSNGLNPDEFCPASTEHKLSLRRKYNLPEDKLLALFVGRFVPKKGLFTLFDLPAIPNLHVVFVGGVAPPGHTREDQHFLGMIDRRSMPNIYQLSDIFILPSQSEGFPVTAQEAMASGLPVIMTDDPAYDLYELDKTLVKLVASDGESIGDALASTAADPELRRVMGAYSRRYALENFDERTKVVELMEMYGHQLSGLDKSRGNAANPSTSDRLPKS
jgi:glycosyltransferase involved in cell wall biosynthesis